MKLLLKLFPILLLSGCAYLKTQMQNDPTVKEPNGNVVIVGIFDKNNERFDDTLVGRRIKNEGLKWLVSRGYKLTENRSEAHTHVLFVPREQKKNVYIPAETYSVPIYGNAFSNGQTYNSTVKDQNGELLGTIKTQEVVNPLQPTSYQTQYREGYNTTVTDQSIELIVWRAERGKYPKIVSNGYVYPSEYSLNLFESDMTVNEAVSKLLTQSTMGMIEKAPESRDGQAPGCWPMLGFSHDDVRLEKEKKLIIKEFVPKTKASEAGLKIGDEVLKIGNVLASENRANPFPEGEIVEVQAKRGKKEFKVKVPAIMTCP